MEVLTMDPWTFITIGDIEVDIFRLTSTLIILIVITVIYKFLSRSITQFSKRLGLEPHVQNSIRLVLRVITLVVLTAALFEIYELPTSWLIGSSALAGAAIGFGSSQTINNIVAGFYVVISRPFSVKDYVMIGDVEGVVEEITINYTKLYTPSFNLLLIPNMQVINSRIMNCTHEGFIKYTFFLSFPHGNIQNDELMKKCINPAIEEFYQKYRENGLRKPEGYYETTGNFGRTFKIRIFAPKGDAKSLYLLRSELADMITDRWDIQRSKLG
ncbi:MAG: mechanosensitive ion channel family protein [Nitrososphaeria archaeon]